ncbi:MAG: glycosyltransferase, exosortase A system-associated [Magnetococcus sp. YQC-5]
MRILHILDHSAPLQSGYVFRTLSILRQQRAMGWETLQLTGPKHSASPLTEEMASDLLFYRTPQQRTFSTRLPILGQISVITALRQRILTLAKQHQPDVLHAHSPVLNGLAALSASRQLGIPMVYEVRAFWEDAAASHGTGRAWGARYRLTRALETHVMRQADGVTVICEGLRRDIISREIAAEKVTVIPNAVEAQRFASSPPSALPLLPNLDIDGKEILGYLGSFYSYEGLSVLLEALPSILACRPQVFVLLIGGGPEEERLRQQVARMGLDKHVCFTGRTPPEAAPHYYAMTDLLVYPRLPMRLTHLVTPLKPLEAMAAKRLVLASDVEGHKELITHGQTGFLFQAGQPDALARAVIELLENRATWDPVIRQAERFVLQKRNWSASVEGYRPLYDRLLQTHAKHTIQVQTQP